MIDHFDGKCFNRNNLWMRLKRRLHHECHHLASITQYWLLQMPYIATTQTCFYEFDPRIFYVFEDKKVAYLTVPKVASNAILFAIGQCYELQSGENIHVNPVWHIERNHLTKKQASYYKFAFVRNPFDRLVSCYKEKIVRYRREDWPNFYKRPHFYISREASFAEFVMAVAKIPDCVAERHFKSQYAMVYDKDYCLVDDILHFENLDQDWRDIAHIYEFNPVLQRLNPSGIESDYQTYYTPELVDLVYHRYQKDVAFFGYEQAYQTLRASIQTA